jgi:hypothetical protein
MHVSENSRKRSLHFGRGSATSVDITTDAASFQKIGQRPFRILLVEPDFNENGALRVSLDRARRWSAMGASAQLLFVSAYHKGERATHLFDQKGLDLIKAHALELKQGAPVHHLKNLSLFQAASDKSPGLGLTGKPLGARTCR